MSSELLVSRPQIDSRAVAQDAAVTGTSVQAEIPRWRLSSESAATAGYRSAKYTPAEWFSNYHTILRQAGTDHQEAKKIQRGSKFLNQTTEAATLKKQADGTRLLGERLHNIHHWRSELQRHIERLRTDIESLQALRIRLERATDATETPYAIATDNLTCRAARLGPDLVRDSVEEELLKEVDLIRSIQALLKSAREQVIRQIKINQEAKQTLEMDWSDKYQAYNLDNHCGSYSNMSPDTKKHPSSAALQEQVCNQTSWTKFTQDNLTKATHEEQATDSLRGLVERLLDDTTKELQVQCSTVDQAFNHRCEELTEAKSQLEMKHRQVLEEIVDQERNIVLLQQAIYNKEAPLRVAQSRLYTRALRPNIELCRDDPQISLEDEVRQIESTVASLQLQLSEARGSLSHLEESRTALEKDIQCKAHSLFIDRQKCMSHRKRYPSITRLSGY
ncbi:tektin-4 [Synchiropus picturatus]